MTTATKIERAKELDRNATPGPWTAQADPDPRLASWGFRLTGPRTRDHDNSLDAMEPADGEFIAESRTLLPALAADLESAHQNLAHEKQQRACYQQEATSWRVDYHAVSANLATLQANFDTLSKRATEERERLKGELEAEHFQLLEAQAQLRDEQRAHQRAAVDRDDARHGLELETKQAKGHALKRWAAEQECDRLKKQLSQAGRDREATRELRQRIENLTRYDSHTAHSMISKEGGGFLRRADVLCLFDLALDSNPLEGGAEKAEPGLEFDTSGDILKVKTTKPAWLLELERLGCLIADILDGEAVSEPGDAERFKALGQLYNLRCIVLDGKGKAAVPREIVRYFFALWAYDYTATVDGNSVLLRCQEGHKTRVEREMFMLGIDERGAEILAHRDDKTENMP